MRQEFADETMADYNRDLYGGLDDAGLGEFDAAANDVYSARVQRELAADEQKT